MGIENGRTEFFEIFSVAVSYGNKRAIYAHRIGGRLVVFGVANHNHVAGVCADFRHQTLAEPDFRARQNVVEPVNMVEIHVDLETQNRF